MGGNSSRPRPILAKLPPGVTHELVKRNNEIESALTESHKRSELVKILLLGSGESGKSTVIKQMRLIHGDGFTPYERAQYTKVIWCDTVQCMRTIIDQASRIGETLDCDAEDSPLRMYRDMLLITDDWDILKYETNQQAQIFLRQYDISGLRGDRGATVRMSDRVSSQKDPRVAEKFGDRHVPAGLAMPTRQQVAQAVHELWTKDAGIRRVHDKSNLFQLEANASYYFDKVFDFAAADYRASDQDILVGRIKTTGVFQMMFTVKDTPLRMFDVGGQRSERDKWIHTFDDVTAVLFVVASSEYDEVLYEDHSVNRLHESLTLFGQICNSPWFAHTPVVLFMNKMDLLTAKLRRSPIKSYFPNFDGDPYNPEQVCEHMEELFVSMNRVRTRQIYIRRTCATDTQSMAFVMSAVTDIIFQRNLAWAGMI